MTRSRALIQWAAFCMAATFSVAGLAAPAAGQVTLLTGRATAAGANGTIRALERHSQVFEGDMISTGPASYVNLKFEDGGRVLLRPNSRFGIEHFSYHAKQESRASEAVQQQQPQAEGNAFFRLLKGGFRAISGILGHHDHNNYRVRTPVATIGIRGTDYEVRYCQGDCLDVDPLPKNGLYTAVNKGAISVRNQAGEKITLADQFTYVAGPDIAAKALPFRPRALAQDPIPDPAACGD
ncbi:MAG: FecR domain-containing protein [Gammaproteobacteria bacterium]|jgi:hypothetical protein